MGFWLFPNGWHWTEFHALTPADRCEYEQYGDAATSRDFFVEIHEAADSAGRLASENGSRYRRQVSRTRLAALLYRGIVSHYFESDKYIHPDAKRQRPIDPAKRFFLKDYESMHVERSTIGGATIYQGRETFVDAPKLIEHILSSLETRGRPKIGLWHEVEFEARKVIECSGFPLQQSMLTGRLQEFHLSRMRDRELRKSSLDALVKSLAKEYGAK